MKTIYKMFLLSRDFSSKANDQTNKNAAVKMSNPDPQTELTPVSTWQMEAWLFLEG